jgi:hypothetical protein
MPVRVTMKLIFCPIIFLSKCYFLSIFKTIFSNVLVMISAKIMDGETFCTYPASTIASLSGHLI